MIALTLEPLGTKLLELTAQSLTGSPGTLLVTLASGPSITRKVTSSLAFRREALPTLRYFPNDTELAHAVTMSSV